MNNGVSGKMFSSHVIYREGTEKGNLGNRLLQFFYYYGFVFNYEKLVLRVRGDGGFVTKEEKDWFDEAKDYYLSVENPIDTSLDVGKSSYNIKVRVMIDD